MKAVSLNAFERALTRRGGAKRLRASGRVPAVMYGRSEAPCNLEVNAKELEDLVQRSASETILVDLKVAGERESNQLALVQEIQHHPLSGRLLHVDFHQVAADEKVTVTLPLESEGVAEGVKAGGVLEHVVFKVKLRGMPKDLPDVVVVDVEELGIGQTITLGEVELPGGVAVIGDPALPVLAVAAPLTEAQETAVAEGEEEPVAQPEMIKEKKESEGEAKK
jgi:large subunit ribosomal protein L25